MNNNMDQIIKSNLTKSTLNKIIKYSSSMYNAWKKGEVVNTIITGMKEGGVWYPHWKSNYSLQWQITRDIAPLKGMDRIEYLQTEFKFSSGSYCECSSMTRTGTYHVNFTDKTLKDIENNIIYQF
jgi:hypothetical protein